MKKLTRRVREVADLAAKGLGAKEIATRLGISEGTARNHLGRAYLSLGLTGFGAARQLMARADELLGPEVKP